MDHEQLRKVIWAQVAFEMRFPARGRRGSKANAKRKKLGAQVAREVRRRMLREVGTQG